MMPELRNLCWLPDTHEVILIPHYIRSEALEEYLGRLVRDRDSSDCRLNPRVLRYLGTLWGPRAVDCSQPRKIRSCRATTSGGWTPAPRRWTLSGCQTRTGNANPTAAALPGATEVRTWRRACRDQRRRPRSSHLCGGTALGSRCFSRGLHRVPACARPVLPRMAGQQEGAWSVMAFHLA